MCIRQTKVSRKAVASIEFIMMLPVLVTFVVVAFWAARAGTAGLQSGQAAEEAVYEAAIHHTKLNSLKKQAALENVSQPGLEQLVEAFVPKMKIAGGLDTAQSEQDTGEGVYGATPALGKSIDQHFFLSHTWESEVFHFPDGKAQQPPLTFPESIRGIAPQLQDLKEFRQLLQF